MEKSNKSEPEISIVLPCRNEEKAIRRVLEECLKVVRENNYSAEVIVSDSSSDKSPEIVKEMMQTNKAIRLVEHGLFGYGNAYLEGFKVARGKFIVMLDADGSYDPLCIPKFVRKLREGNDLVMGNRFNEGMKKGAMPKSHKLIGNPVLSAILRLFFGSKVKDAHCGMRGIKKDVLEGLRLKAKGMEFASEMIVKAEDSNLRIAQFDIPYHKRIGESKLRTFQDGWRHLRFLLLFSPLFLFFIPGLLLLFFGLVSGTVFYFSLDFLGRTFDFHPMFVSSLLVVLGYQLVAFSVFSRTYAFTHFGFGGGWLSKVYEKVSLESFILIGFLFIFFGALVFSLILLDWVLEGFGALNQVKNSIVASTCIMLGFQTIFSGFMLSVLGIKE